MGEDGSMVGNITPVVDESKLCIGAADVYTNSVLL
jgi:hypothetical protein